MRFIEYLKGKGIKINDTDKGWVIIKCPFHEDKVESASFNTETERFKCFKCDKVYNFYMFLHEGEGKSKQEAYQISSGGLSLIHI